MDLNFTPEEVAFRAEVRAFLASNIPEHIKQKQFAGHELSKEDIVTVQRVLNARGWAVPHWPVEWGGQDWTPVQHYIFNDELELASVPTPLPFNTALVGPVIAAFGSDELKKRFLAPTANLDIWWCQGFSEPEAGSDLASVKTTATRDGDFYVVNGQKTWTTQAHLADWIFCLVRTDPTAKKQAGISFILFDMRSPGVNVRPIQLIDGGHEVNEVFLDDVRVPIDQLVGEENKGWSYAKFLLGQERSSIARTGFTKTQVQRIKTIAKRTPSRFGTMLDDPIFRRRLTELEVELKALEIMQLRVVTEEGKHKGNAANPMTSVLKIKGSDLQQTATELLLDLLGPAALPASSDDGAVDGYQLGFDDRAIAKTYFNWRKVSIFGGSNEIQRNIISKAILAF
jgi:alkylation response protein AidB-like acyl-CoA dehydrogenase